MRTPTIRSRTSLLSTVAVGAALFVGRGCQCGADLEEGTAQQSQSASGPSLGALPAEPATYEQAPPARGGGPAHRANTQLSAGHLRPTVTPVVRGWSAIALPVALEGRTHAVVVGSDVWLMAGNAVVRVEPSKSTATVADNNALGLRGVVAAVPAGEGVILGWSPTGGGLYRVATDTLTPITREGAPEVRVDVLSGWSGAALLLWHGGSAEGRGPVGAGYYPAGDRWAAISTDASPGGRVAATAVEAGEQWIVFGGLGPGDVPLSDGGMYSAAADRWRATPAQNAPSARAHHTAVWTGREMLVWGGRGPSGELATGAALDPSTGTWRAITTAGAPAARHAHVAVWTGARMIVWGGTGEGGERADGGSYDPVANQWTPLEASDAAPARQSATATWLAGEMLIAGGTHEGAAPTNVLRFRPE